MIRGMISSADQALARIPAFLPLLVLRIALAVPFWRSGLTKWDGFLVLSPNQSFIFAGFRLNVLGFAIPYPFPAQIAFVTGVLEIVLPILLIIGLMTRFSALGLLLMTIVIQLTVPSAWANFHLPWFAMAFALVVFGPGRISLDALMFGRAEPLGLRRTA